MILGAQAVQILLDVFFLAETPQGLKNKTTVTVKPQTIG